MFTTMKVVEQLLTLGVTCKLIDGNRGMFTANQLKSAVAGRADIRPLFKTSLYRKYDQ